MAERKRLCQMHGREHSPYGNRLPEAYLGVAEVRALPAERRREDHLITRGYAAGIGQWFFFPALEPAVAFGRAARMSTECSGYGVYEAARELKFCDWHLVDEIVLLINMKTQVDRVDPETDLQRLKRFVQGVKEAPWSAHWHEPTGYITEMNDRARVVTTPRKSLPL